ncbi:hypothetical protein L6452_34379 [Arctium lappa]|uniref:Uncharacterized protein n=1 Tax=Arctium lappa TaxID=4217 RepID=A0ACB8YI25_ARCLA|nr:hypothetical protein L6452_34379 [Arctium lappa]
MWALMEFTSLRSEGGGVMYVIKNDIHLLFNTLSSNQKESTVVPYFQLLPLSSITIFNHKNIESKPKTLFIFCFLIH